MASWLTRPTAVARRRRPVARARRLRVRRRRQRRRPRAGRHRHHDHPRVLDRGRRGPERRGHGRRHRRTGRGRPRPRGRGDQAQAAAPGREADDAGDARGVHARPRPTASAPTTTAASCSTRTWRRTRSSPAPSCSPATPRSCTTSSSSRCRRTRSPTPRPSTPATPGEGWTCFGGTGLRDDDGLNTRPWLGAWAPGGKESVQPPGFGMPLAAGSRIIMQVHYNLLAGPRRPTSPPPSSGWRPATADLTPLRHDAAAGAGRAAVPPEHDADGRCATARPRSPT